MEKQKMIKTKIYELLPMNEKTKILYALAEEDYSFMAKHLKNFKINENIFIEMCDVAISNNSINSLKILLDLYTPFHTQEVFDKLTEIISNKKAYNFSTFISQYIDDINTGRTNENNDYKIK